MEWYMAILYGIIQGLAEFLPISSSGHLALFQSLFSLESTDSLSTQRQSLWYTERIYFLLSLPSSHFAESFLRED